MAPFKVISKGPWLIAVKLMAEGQSALTPRANVYAILTSIFGLGKMNLDQMFQPSDKRDTAAEHKLTISA